MTNLADKRVAIIGTGATAVQCIPHLARACGELYVFQRTPSSVDVRANRPTDPEWFAEIATPGWQQRWLENFTLNQTPGAWPADDLVQDGWTDLSRRIRDRIMSLPPDQFTPEKMMAAFEEYDFEKMSEIRARVDSIVEDPATAEHLKAWYRQLCKRPCFHDEYLQSYNEPGTHLVDTDGKGVERITENAVVVAGVEYEVDCIIYASGFEVGTPQTRRNGYDMTGRDGVKLSEYWADGMRTLHGMQVHGFPNAVHRAALAGRHADLERAPQLHRSGLEHRRDPEARGRRGATPPSSPRKRQKPRGCGTSSAAWAATPSPTPTARPATTTTRASPSRRVPSSSSATRAARWRTSPTCSSGGALGSSSGSTTAESVQPASTEHA